LSIDRIVRTANSAAEEMRHHRKSDHSPV
jgi:hypothetical protein